MAFALTWTYWRSVRDNDGRRASGIRYNRSKWHVATPEDKYALCGREIVNPSEKFVPKPPPDAVKDGRVCGNCVRMVRGLEIDYLDWQYENLGRP